MSPKLTPFSPAPGMANPHVQTILSSIGRKIRPPKQHVVFDQSARTEIIKVDGVHLEVKLNLQAECPLIMIIPGWLGSVDSSYVRSAAHALHTAGYAIARINLRDHGATAHLNEGMFNSALINEVIAAVNTLQSRYGKEGAGLVGYSLGGNFALRVARASQNLPTLAECPAIEPAATMYRIDSSPIYQRYFVRKWRSVWREKQAAFPNQYDFGDAMVLNTVSALTDYFVRYHSEFESTDAYFKAYDLSNGALKNVDAHILAASDDPIIPVEHYSSLPENLTLNITERGGHGAYLESWQLDSWADRYAIAYFNKAIKNLDQN